MNKKRKNKIINLLILPFLLIGIFFGIKYVHAQTVQLTQTDSGWFWARTYKNKYSSWHWSLYNFNDRVAYCIEPTVPEGTDYETGDWSYSKLSNDLKEKMLLVAYYGYEYPGHNTLEYRAATQSLLWEYAGTTPSVFSSQRYEKGTIYDVSAERNEILRLVAQHYTKPSFNGTTVTANVGETFTITDNNNVLSNYEIYSSPNAEVSINGNQLSVRTTNVGKVNIRLAKKTYTNREYLVYHSPNHQTMLSSGAVDPVYADININSLGGKVDFVKYDKDTDKAVPQGEAKLNGAVYGIYDAETDALIGKVTTNSEGYAISDNLPKFGNFYLKEITPSEGYLLDETKYYFSSTLDQKNASLKVKEKVITRDFEFTKVYASDKTQIMTPEAGVEFGIYNSKGELVAKEVTDKDGKIYVTLPYGHYTLRQLTSTKDYEKLEDYHFEVKETGKTNKVFSNAEIKAKLKVVKIDSKSHKIIARAHIKFKIYDLDRHEFVSQTITYPTATTIDVFETDDNGVLITPYALKSGNYLLMEVDQIIDGYLWNQEAVPFTIGEDADLYVDKDYGVLVVVEFANQEVKGEVELNKVGEELVIEDNSYHYEEKKLDGVVYELYADEDIYSGDGTLIYHKGDLVGTYTTKDGYLKVTDLYLGKYYFLEKSTVGSHVLDTTKHYFELKYKDQYTPIVSLSFTYKNYLKKSTLEFTKRDLVTGEPLPNTKIQIFTNNDGEERKLIFEGYTDENGKIIIKDLFVSKFVLYEVEAPDGYILNPEPMEFEVTADGEIIKADMTNEKIVEVPNTGLSNINYEVVGSLVLIVSGLGLIGYGLLKKKRK